MQVKTFCRVCEPSCGLVADVDRVQVLANLGVALLMFGLGVEFSLSEVIRVRRAALLGGAIGLGLRFNLPVGPIRLEYGHNMTQDEGEPSGTWQFAIGIAF